MAKKNTDDLKLSAIATKEKDERAKALDLVIGQIEKNFGKGAITNLTQVPVVATDVISTGCLSIDMALGIGGLPKGRIVEIYGPESSGKTTLSLHVIAEAQKKGGYVGFIDAEHALDPVYASKLGVDLSKLYISQPDNGEQGLEIAESLVRSGAFDCIVVDSVAALTPKAEIEGDMGDSHMGLQARLMSQALRKLAGAAHKSNALIIFINQLRDKIGISYGSPETTTGGKALKFYASVRIDVRRQDQIKDGQDVIGNRTKVKIVKNKLAPPFTIAEFDIMYGRGISAEGCVLDLAIEHGIVQKAGSWFSYNDERLGQGRDNVRQILEKDKNLLEQIDLQVRAVIDSKKLKATLEQSELDEDDLESVN